MIFIRSWLSDYLHFLITLCMILSRVLYFEYKFTLLYLRTHWRVGTSLLLRLWLDGELFSVFIGHIICSYAVRVWISLGPFDLRGRNFTITTQPKIWPGCLSRDSNPGLLRGEARKLPLHHPADNLAGLPQPGLEPGSAAWEARKLPLHHPADNLAGLLQPGLEPGSYAWEARKRPLHHQTDRSAYLLLAGVEPRSAAWEARILLLQLHSLTYNSLNRSNWNIELEHCHTVYLDFGHKLHQHIACLLSLALTSLGL